MPQSPGHCQGTGPQREQGLKARPPLVKVVPNPLVSPGLLRSRRKKRLIFRQIGVGGLAKNRLRPATSRFPRDPQRGGPNMATKAATPTTITLKHLAADIAEGHELS